MCLKFKIVRCGLAIIFFADILHGTRVKRIINYETLTQNWTSVRDCPKEIYNIEKNDMGSAGGGVPANEDEYPHIAAIGWTDSSTGVIRWKCGGSLISENFVLTAAHCAKDRGIEPDVVRLGALDLRYDDKKVQKFTIAEIIRHPSWRASQRYHDLALLRLNGSVEITKTVCPACIWTDSAVEFKSLEACGYGKTGYHEDPSLYLVKVKLSPVESSACSKFYAGETRFKSGVSEGQLCAADPEGRMDTCEGDSGGPLQIKLWARSRMHSFIVGVTSFGLNCVTGTPGVYVRVSTYKDWIKSVTGISLDPKECVLRYEKFREEKIVGIDRVVGDEKNNFARLGYNSESGLYWPCGGTFITQLYILTSASCLKTQNTQITHAKTTLSEPEQLFRVAKVIVHPKFVLGNLQNDIALVLLDQGAQFSETLYPICLWDKNDDTYWGRLIGLETFDVPFQDLFENNVKNTYRSLYLNELERSECSLYLKNMTIVDHQLCQLNPEIYIVPGTCQLDIGGPVTHFQFDSGQTGSYKIFIYQFGISIKGEDCGFGHPTVFTKVANFIDWIDSVIFK